MDHTCKLPVWTGGVKLLHGKTVDVNVIDLLQQKKTPEPIKQAAVCNSKHFARLTTF